jgi:hypothetical protein
MYIFKIILNKEDCSQQNTLVRKKKLRLTFQSLAVKNISILYIFTWVSKANTHLQNDLTLSQGIAKVLRK